MEAHLDRFRVRLASTGHPAPAPSSPPTVARSPSSAAHPPGASPPVRIASCERCRHFKKKCSRTLPQCTTCVNAGLKCSLATDTSTVMADLRSRVAWMESFIDRRQLLRDGQTISQIPTGTDLAKVVEKDRPPGSTVSPAASSFVADHASSPLGTYPRLPTDLGTREVQEGEPPPKRARLDNVTTVPSGGGHARDARSPARSSRVAARDRRTFVDAYFRDINRAYPFVDRARVLSTLESRGEHILTARERDVDETIVFLVMAIGYTTLQRAGRVPSDAETHFEVEYNDLLAGFLVQESVDTVQVLLLLAIYSQFDFRGFSTRPIVDMLSRQAIRLGLTRRATADEGLSPAEAERNHRLFWSIYTMDRMIAASAGTPVALNGVNMDIPLPGITVDEFASPECAEYTSMLQTARHLIELRKLEDKVLHRVHLRDHTETISLTPSDRRIIVKDLRTEIEDWYSNGCLLKSADSDDIRIHIHISWLAARYYNLLLLLYYPSQTNPTACLLSKGELVSLAQKHVQANAVRFHQRQLPLNHMTLCRFFPVCMIFLHCFLSRGPAAAPAAAAADVHKEVSICADIMAAYPSHWAQAHHAAAVVRQLASLLQTAAPPPPHPHPHPHGGASSSVPLPPSSSSGAGAAAARPAAWSLTDSDRTWRHAIKVRLTELTRQVLGRGSAYRLAEDWEDADADADADAAAASAGAERYLSGGPLQLGGPRPGAAPEVGLVVALGSVAAEDDGQQEMAGSVGGGGAKSFAIEDFL